MSAKPPGILAVARRLGRLAVKRKLHRLSHRRKAKSGKGRRAVGRKGGGFSILMALFALIMAGQAFGMSALVVHQHAQGVELEARRTGETQPSPEELERAEHIREHHPELTFLLDVPDWPAPERLHRLYVSLALLLTVLFFGVFFLHLSAANQDLGQAGWDMEWLFSFPVRTEGLFLAKLGEFVFSDVWTWLTFWPFLTVLYWRSGFGPAALIVAFVVTLVIAVLQAALRLTAETWLRKNMTRSRLKNVQATGSILGLLGLFGVFALAMQPPDFVFTLGRQLPVELLALPWLAPLMVPVTGVGILVVLAFGLGAVVLTLRWTARQVKDGLLVSSGGPFQAARETRSQAAEEVDAKRWYRGIAGKELRLLVRDRNLMVQTILVPLFVIGMQFIGNRGLFDGSGNPNTAAVIAYGVGAYVLIFGAFAVLVVERKCLWLLFTLPQRMSTLLRRKVKLWGIVALAYCGGMLAFVWRAPAGFDLDALLRPVLALAGVWTLAYVAAGFGALGTDPFEQNERRAAKPQWAYLYMLVVAGYGYTLSGDSLWSILVSLTLLASLAWAVWQKVDEHLPVLLDPVAKPPPRLSLPNGLIAILLFFTLQGALSALFLVSRTRPLLAVTLGYVLAGFIVLLAVGAALRKVPNLGAALGLGRGAPLGALALGAVAGVAAAALGLGWLLLLDAVPALRELKDATPQMTFAGADTSMWVLVGLVVLAAPFFEEWLFRGFLYGGMRTTWGVTRSVVTSALLFAIVHPALSFPAVFGLGLAAALVLERTRVLWAAMVTHAVYNGIVIAVQFAQA